MPSVSCATWKSQPQVIPAQIPTKDQIRQAHKSHSCEQVSFLEQVTQAPCPLRIAPDFVNQAFAIRSSSLKAKNLCGNEALKGRDGTPRELHTPDSGEKLRMGNIRLLESCPFTDILKLLIRIYNYIRKTDKSSSFSRNLDHLRATHPFVADTPGLRLNFHGSSVFSPAGNVVALEAKRLNNTC